jgi:hypothetical protein
MPELTSNAPRRLLLARPERWRFALADDAGATRLELPRRGAGAAALIIAVMFLVSAGALVAVASRLDPHPGASVAALASMLFQLFWILGWSLGVLVLGALTVLLCFYRESAWLARGALVYAPRIGPIRMIAEYDLARMRNLRIEPEGDAARVRFDYGEGGRALGDAMPKADAERLIAAIRAAMPATGSVASAAVQVETPRPAPAAIAPAADAAPQPMHPGAVIALVAANLVPLAGVLFGGWKLDEVMVLFWAESAVIAFYTVLKMAVVGKWLALFAGTFFVGHFGAFMAIHFLFIYQLFVRGLEPWGREPAAYEAIRSVFMPLWPALLALFLSHGVSFAANFIGRREYRSATITDLMAAPYKRVVLMQLTLIAGGWLLMALKTPTPALALLVGLKTAADLRAHLRERARHRSAD